VALARALINQPTLLLADEPTGNLDSQSTAEVLALLHRLNSQGQTILLVTHDARVASAAGRVIYIRDGQIRDETRLEASRSPQSVLARVVQLEG
jgi:putative ABC transport system ATP-binding protein